ncbi:glycosyltransferase family 2 protein [Caballeronia novacaledonica]|uniref:glycosyltransferase family 2 protein n=1 Tax=Caballeronia novacaledonica TaxID=1544861 RepID=UPI001EE2EE62|nr:glycosyltransferase family 2 protein [Caballeronia novacaledonica]GJH09270.1 glycosyltransferase family 2 protein [Caballeronia novacaledonica]
MAAVIVTYNPVPGAFDGVLAALRPQVEQIVIVDNGSVSATADALRLLAERHDCIFVQLSHNLGIAIAQNRGVERIANEASWKSNSERHYFLFLDHDSIAASDMVERLVASDGRLRAAGNAVGALGPVIVDKRTGTRGRFICSGRKVWLSRKACRPGEREMAVEFLISSGTLVRADVLADIGGMNDELFIDHVDTEWCLRALNRGYKLFAVSGAQLTHSLGDEVVEVWMGRPREVFVHSPLRDYYMCRNTILLLRRVPMRFAWRAFLFVRLLGSMAFFGLGVRPRGTRLLRMAQGVRDGCVGRGGRAAL